jgi:hypothetical protein
MKGKTRAFSVCVLLMIISGCISKPVPTGEVEQTPTELHTTPDVPTAIPTLTLIPTFTAIPSFTPTPSALPAPIIPVVTISPIAPFTPLADEESVSPILYSNGPGDSFELLGGTMKSGQWLQAAEVAPYLHGGAYVDLYQAGSSLSVNVLDWNFDPRCQIYYVRSNGSIPGPGVAVKRNWPVQTRTTAEISTDDPVYSQAVTDWLKSQGATPAEVHVTRIIQVDLEGDGVKEVLLSASYFASTVMPVSQAGDYSVVLLRKVVGNDLVTVPVVADFYISSVAEATYPNTYSLVDAIDLNQDGNLEIVVRISRWEGLGAGIYTISNNIVAQVLKTFCAG